MADKRPLCKLCKERHWLSEPHVTKSKVSVMPIIESIENVTLGTDVTKSTPSENVTPSIENVTGRGGVRPGAGRKPEYASNAARQRAYRERHQDY